jgi:hypothetical protein
MGKAIFKAILRGLLGMMIGYLVYELVSVFVFRVPTNYGTAGCIELALGTVFFFASLSREPGRTRQSSSDTAASGAAQIEMREPVREAIPPETMKMAKEERAVTKAPNPICPKCGSVGEPKDLFCRKCGHALT